MVLDSGEAETLKRRWHQAILVLAAGACVYNAAAFIFRRRQPHLAVNTVVYGALVALETQKIAEHPDAR